MAGRIPAHVTHSAAARPGERGPIDTPLYLHASLVGRAARRALAADPAWSVSAVFRRSFYCRSARGALVLVGPEGLGAGPLHVLWPGAGETADRRPDEGMRVGIDLDGTAHATEPLTLGLHDALEWRPPAPPCWRTSSLRRSLAWLERTADRAPVEGLGRLVPLVAAGMIERIDSRHSSLIEIAWPAVAALSGWLRTAHAGGPTGAVPPDAIGALIGLGPGLTPSGDDVLAGALLALHGFARAEEAARLAAWLGPRLAGRTGHISRAHLACAAHGEGAAVLHDALAALASGDAETLATVTAAVGALGHCSGWDGLVGIAAVAAAWLAVGGHRGEGSTPWW
jgi:hypothetical protein